MAQQNDYLVFAGIFLNSCKGRLQMSQFFMQGLLECYLNMAQLQHALY